MTDMLLDGAEFLGSLVLFLTLLSLVLIIGCAWAVALLEFFRRR